MSILYLKISTDFFFRGELEEMPKLHIVHKSASFWREQEKNGKACIMWFTKLDDLIEHVCDNISPKDSYSKNFKLISVNMNNSVVLKDRLKPEDQRVDVYGGPWYDFEELEHGRWILRGGAI